MALIKCPECGKEVSSSAKSCPNCGHPITHSTEKVVEKTVVKEKKKRGCLSTVLIIVVIFCVIGAILSDEDKKSGSSSKSESTKSGSTETEAPKEYISCTVDQMMKDLDDNAMGASEKYKDQYLEITGRLGVIDSSGKYISLYPDDEFALIGVQCYIKNDEQKSAVANMKKNDTVTIKGKCKDVGEVLGYSFDIESIK